MIKSYYEPQEEIIDLSETIHKNERKIIDITNFYRKKDLKITGKITLEDNAYLEIVQIDLGRFNIDFNIEVTLYKSAEFYSHIASLAEGKEKKTYTADVIHIGKYSTSKTSMFGVCSDESRIDFLGKSDIKNGASKTNTRQEGKVINLSGKAKCIVSPSLLNQLF